MRAAISISLHSQLRSIFFGSTCRTYLQSAVIFDRNYTLMDNIIEWNVICGYKLCFKKKTKQNKKL